MTITPHRVLLLDSDESSEGISAGNRFTALARLLVQAKLDVVLATVSSDAPAIIHPPSSGGLTQINVGPPDIPLVCGRGHATETIALRRAYWVAQQLGDMRFDAVLAPLRGGLAHGLLMRRTNELQLHAPTIALWCDAPTRTKVLDDDRSPTDVAPLVADALERSTLRLSDLLIGPHATAFDRIRSLGEPMPPTREATLPDIDLPPAMPIRPAGSGRIEELVFIGSLDRMSGARIFMDAIEQLAADGVFGDRRVTILSPASPLTGGVNLDLFGIRAANWPFRFQVLDVADPAKVIEYVSSPNRLAVFAAIDAEDDRLLRAVLNAGYPAVASVGYDATRPGGPARQACASDAGALTAALKDFIEGSSAGTCIRVSPSDWRAVMANIIAAPHRRPSSSPNVPGSVSVGVLHHDRVEYLRRALQSIPAARGQTPTEVIVIDNASAQAVNMEALDPSGVVAPKLVRLDRHETQLVAYNRIATEASNDVVIFLDDDNTFASGGIERLLRSLESGWFDIVVSTLDLVDGNPAVDASSGRQIFLGDPGLSGLFFNGFGDTAMAVRRDAFLKVGGFSRSAYRSGAPDWIFLAKARAAGLRIGVLMEPAVCYARRPGTHRQDWRKNDVEGIRRAVAAAYGSALDAPLLTRFAQGLQLAGP